MNRSPFRKSTKVVEQFGKYVITGGIAFTVDFLVLYALTEFASIHYLVSATIAFTLGLATNYTLCITWIFGIRAVENRLAEFTIFTLVGIGGLLLNNLTMFLLTGMAGVHYLASKIAAAAIVLMFNFSLRRTLLFTDRTNARKARPST